MVLHSDKVSNRSVSKWSAISEMPIVNLPERLHLPAAGLNTVGKGLMKLAHGGQVLLSILDVLKALGVLGLKVFLENALESLLVLAPLSTVNIGLGLSLANLVG